ncbi:MAG: ATP-binding cassette domain-containing protein [bacterium]
MRIEVRDLSFDYQAETEAPLLREINLTITSGSCWGVVGSNGAGKSTLAQLLAGLLQPSSGEIFRGHSHRKVGLVFQFPENQFFEGTLYEDCADPLRLQGLSEGEIMSRVELALADVGLGRELYGTSPFDLSGGEARLAAIAAVLATDPGALILDEPTAGLDLGHSARVIDLLKGLRRKRKLTVIVISHHVENILALSEHAVFLHRGRALWQGPVDQLLNQHKLLQDSGMELPPVAQLLVDLKARGWRIDTTSCRAVTALKSIKKALDNHEF